MKVLAVLWDFIRMASFVFLLYLGAKLGESIALTAPDRRLNRIERKINKLHARIESIRRESRTI